MQTSTITARNINSAKEQHVGDTYPFSAQYKGDSWRVFNAALSAWGKTHYATAREADAECQRLAELGEKL